MLLRVDERADNLRSCFCVALRSPSATTLLLNSENFSWQLSLSTSSSWPLAKARG